jgi:hypothetical protein
MGDWWYWRNRYSRVRLSAKSWAVEADAVDGTEFSAKVYAGSGSTLNAGSAKNWALGGGDSFSTSTTIGNTGLYSAKYWAEQAQALSKDGVL